MTSDRLLVRVVGFTVCALALIAVGVSCIAALRDVEVPDSLTQLAYLLAGGLLGALTTRLTGTDPLPVTNAPGEALATTDTPLPPIASPVKVAGRTMVPMYTSRRGPAETTDPDPL